MLENFPPVSDFKTRKEWQRAAWAALIEQLEQLEHAELRKFFELITSVSERDVITLRAAIIARSQEGKSYRAIGRELWVSSQTISHVRKGLKKQSYESSWNETKFRKIVKRAEKWRSREKPLPPRYRRTKYGKIQIW